MRLVHSPAELAEVVSPWRQAGQSIALVPTMGNLHAGHISLVERARVLAARVVVSVFVNPLQFGPHDDFDRYPRTLDADAARLKDAGADLLFAPSVAEMYPGAYPPMVSLKVGGALNDELEGRYRPGHFDGVATVVNLLLTHVRPAVAVFGEKDWQQLAVIRQMALDLVLPVRIEGVATLRELDGLAMSSRNQYLSAEDRLTAPALHAALSAIAVALKDGRRDFDVLCRNQLATLESIGFSPQYLEVRAPDLSPATADAQDFVIVIAAYLGKTRLIDNLQVHAAE